jgi:hypothetical protein
MKAHESSQHHRFPQVASPQHHRQITLNAASDNQIAVNVITNILLSYRQNVVQLIFEILFFPNASPKNLGVAYTHASMVF